MRISDWSSDVCSSDLILGVPLDFLARCPVRFIVDGRDHAQIVPQRGDVFHLGRRFREAVERDERVVIVEGLAIPRLVRNTASEDGLELFISFAQGLADFRAVIGDDAGNGFSGGLAGKFEPVAIGYAREPSDSAKTGMATRGLSRRSDR